MRSLRLVSTLVFAIGICRAASLTAQDVATTPPTTDDLSAAQVLLNRPVTVNFNRSSLADAIDVIIARAHLTVAYRRDIILQSSKSITLRATNVPCGTVIKQVLEGTGFQLIPEREAQFVLVARRSESSGEGRAAFGTIRGHVTDAKSGRPLHGARVTLEGTTKSVSTESDGAYVLADIPAGSYTVVVKSLGYQRQTRRVDVADDGVRTLNIALEPGVNQLDQVVVTGTVIPTDLKSVPNAITVITAKDLEQRGITHVDQLFRGDVPGLFAINQGAHAPLGKVVMWSRGPIGWAGASGSIGANSIKTYVDGVELADPTYLNQIDPRSIERIEILTGPQASTIYGSGAINGVMQIFTKRGTSERPQVTATLLSGFLQNNFSSALAPQHDYSAQVSGTEGHWSYNMGGSWNHIGHWSPGIQQTTLSGFGGGRMQRGHVTADVSVRISTMFNRERGTGQDVATDLYARGVYGLDRSYGVPQSYGIPHQNNQYYAGQTLSMTLAYAPISWWTHEFVAGTDVSDVQSRTAGITHIYPADTGAGMVDETNRRTSLKYAMTMQAPTTSWSRLTLSMGVDGWHSLNTNIQSFGQVLTGDLSSGYNAVSRQPGHNTGGFLQSQLGIGDAVFFTYGLRAEWNPNYGADAQPNYAPRYGVALTRDLTTPLGTVTAKVRGSYGRATVPPLVSQKLGGILITDPYYGTYLSGLPNPHLGPSFQQGGEGGVELYFGNRASLVATRFNQTVDQIVLGVFTDSVRSLQPNPPYGSSRDANGYKYLLQGENLNAGDIRNQGWELQGTTVIGPITTKGTYSWTKSRVIGVAAQFAARQDRFPQFRKGASFQDNPEHTWALGMTYGSGATSLTVNVTGTMQTRVDITNTPWYLQNSLSYSRLYIETARQDLSGNVFGIRSGYAMADLNLTHRFTARLEGLAQVQNLTNHYVNEYDNTYATLGRQTKAGVRLRY